MKIERKDNEKWEALREQVQALLTASGITPTGALWVHCDGVINAFSQVFPGADRELFCAFMAENVWDLWKKAQAQGEKAS